MLGALKTAWMRAVALVWDDPSKLELLKRDPRRFFRAYCDHDMPAGLEVDVRDARERPPGDGHAEGLDAYRASAGLPASRITLYIPAPPRLEERAVALVELADPRARLPPCVC